MSDYAWLIAGQPDTYPAARNEESVPGPVLETACQQASGTLVVFPRNGKHGYFDLNAWKASKTPNPWYPWRTMVQRAMFLGELEAGACLARAFYYLPHLEHVDFGTLKGNAACDLSSLFAGCAALETVDLTAVFKGTCAENVSEMFYGCTFLSSVEFPDGFFDEVTDASMMFYGCTSIRAFSFDWRAERLESAQGMFANCKGVRTVSLPFATFEKCKNVAHLFRGDEQLQTVSIPKYERSEAVNCIEMFSGCSALIDVDLPALEHVLSCERNDFALRGATELERCLDQKTVP